MSSMRSVITVTFFSIAQTYHLGESSSHARTFTWSDYANGESSCYLEKVQIFPQSSPGNLNQPFVENLIELRNHYQSLQQKTERERTHAQEQLAHVNALMVDHFVTDQGFVESLIELRHQYQGQVAECDHQASHFKQQVAHVNALLADQLVQQHEEQVSIAASTSNQNLSLVGATHLIGERAPEARDWEEETEELDSGALDETPKGVADSVFPPAENEQLADDLVQPGLDLSPPDRESPDELEELTPLEGAAEVALSEIEIGEDSRGKGRLTKKSGPPVKTPMLPQFQHLTKFQALEQIMQEKAGSILHFDWLIRALHGELAEDDIPAERVRMKQTLKYGVQDGLWDKVPGESGCYTLDLKQIDPDLAKKAKQGHQVSQPQTNPEQSQPSLPMLPAYSNLKLIDAVALIVNENAGQVLTTEQVTKTLYGALSGSDFRQAKQRVAGALWRGAEAERWQNFPGEKGIYTLDLRLVEPDAALIAEAMRQTGRQSHLRKRGREPVKVLPAYSRLTLVDAIATVLREHSGEVMTSETVAKTLFGDLSGISEATARKRVGKALWDGASRNRWQRLQGESGKYTLDLRLINPGLDEASS